jgi:NAD(P)-dependent dehydrogenase (short-subunit alcohol dehydrogenase family)
LTGETLLKELFGLDGQAAVVTGAGRGIGRAIALSLARAGAQVAVAARDPTAARPVVQEIERAGGHAVALAFDLGDEVSISKLMADAHAALGGLDILVNNAGIFPATSFLDTSAEQWDEIHRINLRGAFLCLREAARLMKADGRGGRIINISSMGSIRPAAPQRFAYNASKAGLNRLTEDAASAFAADRILVNAVLPGPIETGPAADAATAKLYEAVIRRIPARRRGRPEEIAAAVIFLAGRSGGFVTGQCLAVDGGFALG